ncbi:MAG: hypothetical protein LBE86_06920 [Gemmobacter sp.]|jgi:hypothetical protein|nr:hypothetical protein [Gemmobacter sp.]
MRRVLAGDLHSVARVLLALPAADWAQAADRLITEAHAAHHAFKRRGRACPDLGDGSLMGRAGLSPQRWESGPSDPVFLAALAVTIGRLLSWYEGTGRIGSGSRRKKRYICSAEYPGGSHGRDQAEDHPH